MTRTTFALGEDALTLTGIMSSGDPSSSEYTGTMLSYSLICAATFHPTAISFPCNLAINSIGSQICEHILVLVSVQAKCYCNKPGNPTVTTGKTCSTMYFPPKTTNCCFLLFVD